MNVLNTQARIRLVKPDRSAVCSRSEVNELLKELSARRGWCALSELEQEIEDRSNIFSEIGNVLVKRTVVHGEETNLIVFQLDELCKMRCADSVEIFCRSATPRSQD